MIAPAAQKFVLISANQKRLHDPSTQSSFRYTIEKPITIWLDPLEFLHDAFHYRRQDA